VLIFVLAAEASKGANMANALESMIGSYGEGLIHRLEESKTAADRTGDPYERGCACGYYMALTMLVIRAKSRGVDLRVIGLESVDPDDLI
jgi:hypothetical protein